jgi:hypothetical protein
MREKSCNALPASLETVQADIGWAPIRLQKSMAREFQSSTGHSS